MMWFSTSIIAKRAFTLTPEVWSSVLANLWRWIWSDCSFGPLPAPPPIPDQNGAIRYGWISLGGWRRNPRAGSEDPAFVLSRAGVFLSSQPVLHNLVPPSCALHKALRAAIGWQFNGKTLWALSCSRP